MGMFIFHFPHLQGLQEQLAPQPQFSAPELISDPSKSLFTGANPTMRVSAVVISEKDGSEYSPHLQSLPQEQLEPHLHPEDIFLVKIEKDLQRLNWS